MGGSRFEGRLMKYGASGEAKSCEILNKRFSVRKANLIYTNFRCQHKLHGGAYGAGANRIFVRHENVGGTRYTGFESASEYLCAVTSLVNDGVTHICTNVTIGQHAVTCFYVTGDLITQSFKRFF